MKVAHVLRKYDPDQWGGTETAVHQLLGGLRAQQVQSVVFAPKLPRQPTNADHFRDHGHPVRRYRAFAPVLGISAANRESLFSVGGNIMSATLPWHLLREPHVRVVHTHALGRLGGIARVVARRRRLPLVATIHGGYLDLPGRVRANLAQPLSGGLEYGKIFGWLLGARRVLQSSAAVLTCNPREAELLREKLPGRRVRYIPHGVDASPYVTDHRAAAEALLPSLRGRRILLSVGRIDATKNQIFLVDQMPQIRARFPNALLVLAGATTDPGHERAIRTRIEQFGLHHSVSLVGPLPPADPRLTGLYQSADVFLLSSISETFGLVLLESWLAGTPVIASRTSGAVEVVDHGSNGHLFDLDFPDGFHDALGRTLDDPEWARGAGLRGRAMAQKNYELRAVAGQMRDLYQELTEAC